MSNLIELRQRSITYYAFGGSGINIVRAYRENQPKQADICAQQTFCFADSSISNLEGVEKAETYLLKGTDGSGGNRAKNAGAIMAALPELMTEHRPSDLNIVVFSLTGGTGAAGGPLLLEALLAAGHNAVGVCVFSSESTRRLKNGISTLTGLELAVQRINRPINLFYRENDRTLTHDENNIQAVFALGALAIMASGRNGSLDSADISNLFDYQNVTHHKPMLTRLEIYAKEEDLLKDHQRVIAIASLLQSNKNVAPMVESDYDATAFQPEGTPYQNPFYFTISSGSLKARFDELALIRDDVGMKEKIVAPIARLSNGNEKVDQGTGLVFD